MPRRKIEKNETKRQKFLRLGTLRTREVLDRLRILGNCANRNSYDYTRAEINKIFSEIENLVKETKTKFYFPKAKDEEFKL